MATATLEQPVTRDPNAPVDLPMHEADKARRAAERLKKKPLLDQCCDPEFAARTEARKAVYEWKVSAKFMRKQPDARGREKLQTIEHEEKVTAHNETDAWAMFCDAIGRSVSPNEGTHTITRLNKIN